MTNSRIRNITVEVQDVNTGEHPVLKPKLGEYSNDPATYWKERQEARSAITHDVGDHVLTLDPTYKLYVPSRKDGRPVDKSLNGRWTSAEAFAIRLNQLRKREEKSEMKEANGGR